MVMVVVVLSTFSTRRLVLVVTLSGPLEPTAWESESASGGRKPAAGKSTGENASGRECSTKARGDWEEGTCSSARVVVVMVVVRMALLNGGSSHKVVRLR